ncbi:MAG: hypothetical protein N2487_03300 [Verrucomicrobiae bacterium]|nr:hypothetical protein [Verrucomicrobiae bacterium]
MNAINATLSAVDAADLLPGALPEASNPWLSEALIVVGLILALFCVALMIIWALKEKKTVVATEKTTNHDNSNSSGGWGSFFSKRHHRKYKKRFPTLAEKGGLPPRKETETRESASQL